MIDYDGSLKENHHSFKTYDVSKQIGAFKITKEDGISYHYAKAVYSYDYVNKSIDKQSGTSVRTVENKQPYAYTWLLTGITGPDFVDRGGGGDKTKPNGYLDENDWGYWVGFSYGMDDGRYDYQWRLPYSGYEGDLQGTHSYSYGKREDTYLKAVYTKTHTALFIIDPRGDARGAAVDGGSTTLSELKYRLMNILLVKNDKVNVADNLPESIHLLSNGPEANDKDVLTISDIARFEADHGIDLFKVHERRVYLEQDYSLVPFTENSYNGKLTLKNVEFFHKGSETSIIPPIKFEYDESGTSMSARLNYLDEETSYLSLDGSFETGDIIKISAANGTSYARTTGSGRVKFLGGDPFSSVANQSVTVTRTKNPPALKNSYDSWGYFKSDYSNPDDSYQNMDFFRQTTKTSAKQTDVWSLRQIKNPIGSAVHVEYESNRYVANGIGSKKLINFKPGYRVKFKDGSNNDVWLGSDEMWSSNDEFAFSRNAYYKVKGEGYSLVQPLEIEFQMRESDAGDILASGFYPGRSIEMIINGIVSGEMEHSGPLKHSFSIKSITENKVVLSPISNYFSSYFNGLFAKSAYSNTHRIVNLFGFISFDIPLQYGGGIRVKALRIEGGINSQKTTYLYEDGVTSYEPFYDSKLYLPEFEEVYDYVSTGFHYSNWYKYENEYQKTLNQNSQLVDILPSPGVVYGTVSTQSYVDNLPFKSKEVRKFITYDESMTTFDQRSSSYSSGRPINQAKINYILKDKSSQVGLLKSHEIVDASTGNALFTTLNDYQTSDVIANKQGFYEEITNEHRRIYDGDIVGDPNSYVHQANTTRVSFLPTVNKKTVQIDHKLGSSSYTQNLSFDFYSGKVTSVYDEDSYGNKYISKSVPAYQFYDQMGLGFNGGKNMLTQEAASYTYLMDKGFNPDSWSNDDEIKQDASELLTANVQSWSQGIPVLESGAAVERGIYDAFHIQDRRRLIGVPYQNNLLGKKLIFKFEGRSIVFEVISWDENIEGYYVWAVGNKSDLTFLNTAGQEGVVSFYENPHRKHQNFGYTGVGQSSSDGRLSASAFSEIPLGTPVAVSEAIGWQKNSEITKYDIYSHALEASDINENYAATCFDSKNERISATVANARYEEFDYENYENTASSITHTGKGALVVAPGTTRTFGLDLPSKTSTLSAWVHKDQASNFEMRLTYEGATIGSASIDPQKRSGDWYLVEMNTEFSGPVSLNFKNNGSGTLYVDDFRFHPIDATMTSYVYNEWGELTHILDANNLYTEYAYDAMGRLQSVTRETLSHGPVKVSDVQIHYANQE